MTTQLVPDSFSSLKVRCWGTIPELSPENPNVMRMYWCYVELPTLRRSEFYSDRQPGKPYSCPPKAAKRRRLIVCAVKNIIENAPPLCIFSFQNVHEFWGGAVFFFAHILYRTRYVLKRHLLTFPLLYFFFPSLRSGPAKSLPER